MNVSFGRCEDILKTLPIGFYLGHKVTVTLDPKSTDTYINMNDERITISYKCIVNMCKNAKDNCNTEEIIRGLLYHEISHALLSMKPPHIPEIELPKRSGMTNEKAKFLAENWHSFYNIFEDERIESILAKYYYGVNFKRNLVLINNIDPKKEFATTVDPIKKFYIAVRYHLATGGMLTKIKKTLLKFINLTSQSEQAVNREYITAILSIAYDFLEDNMIQAQGQNQVQSQEWQTEDTNSDSDKKGSSDITNTAGDIDNDTLEEIAKKMPDIVPGIGDIPQEQIKRIFKQLSTNCEANAMSARIEKIIRIATAKHNSQASGSAAYAGRIDPRLCKNDDYKWWMKKTDAGSNKRFTKIHFNLFCDNSGSFIFSKNQMNGLILALRKLEEKNKDFSVTFVHCGFGIKLADPDNPYLNCEEGSVLTNNAPALYDSIQKSNATNINLVVFDGDMIEKSATGPLAFKAFNHKNCIVISDIDNQKVFEQYAPNARCTFIDKNYSSVFINAVMTQLERALV